MSNKKTELTEKEKAIKLLNAAINTTKKELSEIQKRINILQENKRSMIWMKKQFNKKRLK